MRSAFNWIASLVVVASLGATCPVQAGFVSVASRGALAGTDFLDWGDLGPQGTVLSNPFNIVSNLGHVVTVSQAAGSAQRIDEGSGHTRRGIGILAKTG